MKENRSLRHMVVLASLLLAATLPGACGDPDKKSTSPASSAGQAAVAVGLNRCTSCHTDVTADWLTTKHGNLDPDGTLDSPGVPTIAQIAGCTTNCHDPNGDSASLVAGYTGNTPRPVIGCEACHGAGSLHAQAGGTGPIGLAGAAGVIGTISTVQVSAQFATCASCHELLDPTNPASSTTSTAAHDPGGSDPRVASEGTNTNIITNTNTNSITDTHFARPNSWDANNGGLNTRNTTTDFIAITGYAMDFSDPKVCTNCHNPHKNATINREWVQSGHADPQGIKIEQSSGAFVGNGFFSSAWAHYNWSDRPTCMRCKTTTAFAAYADAIITGNTALASAIDLGTSPPLVSDPNWKPEMLKCNGCHTDNKGNLRNPGAVTANYNFLSGSPTTTYAIASHTYPDIAGSNVCMLCHTARESGESLHGINDPGLLASGAISPVNFGNFNFINSHYLTAGGQVFTATGYNFGSRSYANIASYKHDKIGTAAAPGTGSNGPCIGCHMSRPNKNGNHIFLPISRISSGGTSTITGITSEVCFTCHGPNDVLMLDLVREQREQYHEALEALKEHLEKRGFFFADFSPYFFRLRDKTGLVSVTTGSAIVTGIGTNWVSSSVTGTTRPKVSDRFRVDSTGTYYAVQSRDSATQITLQAPYAGPTDTTGSSYTIISTRTSNWLSAGDTDTTGNTTGRNNMGAAFNFNLFEHDPGAYAHNRYYVKRLIYDSLDWLDDNILNFSVGTTLTADCNTAPKTWCDAAKTYLLPNGVINGVAAERP